MARQLFFDLIKQPGYKKKYRQNKEVIVVPSEANGF